LFLESPRRPNVEIVGVLGSSRTSAEAALIQVLSPSLCQSQGTTEELVKDEEAHEQPAVRRL